MYSQNELEGHDRDFIYETELNPNEKLIKFMPSAGFGIGYQVAPRFSIGLEHKTTFTLQDQFDGVVSETPRLENDWYHYTSAYLRLNIGGSGNTSSSASNNSGSTTVSSNCPAPTVQIHNTQNSTVGTKELIIRATVKNVNSVSEIKLMDENRNLLPFDFDTYSNYLTATVILNPGSNTFYVKANNNCGNDMSRLNVVYSDCEMPEGSLINPSTKNASVEDANFEIKGQFSGLKSASMIDLYVNNVQIYAFSFDASTGILESNITLDLGTNYISIDYENSCGRGNVYTEINFTPCDEPEISLVSPSASGSTTNVRNHEIHASISGTGIGQSNIDTKLNGKLLDKSDNRNWTYTNNTLKFNVVLINGINTIEISVSNECGTTSTVFTLDYEDCDAPNVTINSPQSGSTVQSPSVSLSAQILSSSALNNISYQLNGQNVTGMNYNPSSSISTGTLTLSPGDNYFTISASNDCGADVETIHLVYDDCKVPNVNITSSDSEVTSENFTFSAFISNMPNA